MFAFDKSLYLIRRLSLAALVLLFFFTSDLFSQARLIVKLKPESVSLSAKWQSSAQSFSDKYSARIEPIFKETQNSISLGNDSFDRSRYLTMTLPDSSQIDQVMDELSADETVEDVEIDHKLEL